MAARCMVRVPEAETLWRFRFRWQLIGVTTKSEPCLAMAAA